VPASAHDPGPLDPSGAREGAVNVKSVLLLLVVIIIVLGATGGDASAAAVGNAIGNAFHWLRVAWDAMVSSGG
jgi:hypothetical protein